MHDNEDVLIEFNDTEFRLFHNSYDMIIVLMLQHELTFLRGFHVIATVAAKQKHSYIFFKIQITQK